MLVSNGGMICIINAVLGFSLTMVDTSHEELLWALILSIVATYIYVAFFNLGLGPITWVYSSEIFPLKLRAQGASIEVAVNRLTNAAISMSFISIYNAITIGGAFFLCLLVYLYGLGCSSTFSCLKPRAWPWKRWRCSSAKTREGSQLQKQTRGRMHSCIYICFLWRGRIFIMSSENLNFIIVLYI